ncbi:response regulator [bacterium]|nr:MAG: response regulator [bacterium]
MKVLIADDQDIARMVLGRTLQNLGYVVDEAPDGTRAMDLYEPGVHQIVIADWEMPGYDGLEVCRRIRALGDGAYTYVILLTAKEDREDRVAALQAGADDFITKPFDRGDLSARLGVARRILRMEGELREANRKIEESREQEVAIGASIQRSLLMARPPEHSSRFEFAAMNLPSRQIDGDFFDFFVHSDGVVDVVLGDAMGKGVPAALVGAGAKSTLLRSLSDQVTRSKGQLPSARLIVQETHDAMTSELIRLNSFVTLGYARLDTENWTATFVDCGHTRPIHWRAAERDTSELPGGGFPIGFVKRETYDERTIPIGRGDLFVFYSDGVTDATGDGAEAFGTERLLTLVQRHAADAPSQLLYRLREAIRTHIGEAPLEDDFTVVIVRVGPVGDPWDARTRTFRSELESLAGVRDFVGPHLLELGFPLADADALLLAVHEATANVVRHAHKGIEDATIEVAVERREGGMRALIRYEGVPFNPPKPDEPDIQFAENGGLGLFLIDRTMDEVHYGVEHGRNYIEMIKNRS